MSSKDEINRELADKIITKKSLKVPENCLTCCYHLPPSFTKTKEHLCWIHHNLIEYCKDVKAQKEEF